MKRSLILRLQLVTLFLVLALAPRPSNAVIEGITMPPDDGKLRIICFGAHPDDCELQAGGTAAMWAAKGHHVLFVSVTNGDIGHWREAGGPLALRRRKEVEEIVRRMGLDDAPPGSRRNDDVIN